jgi:hypothetical protein
MEDTGTFAAPVPEDEAVSDAREDLRENIFDITLLMFDIMLLIY